MSKFLSTLTLAAVLCVAPIVGLRVDASAQSLTGPFNNSSVKGTFACSDQGIENVTIPGYSGDLMFNEITLVTNDGKGHSSGTYSIVSRESSGSLAVFACSYTFTGNYHVNSDGSGTATNVGTLVSGPCSESTTLTSNFIVGGPNILVSAETSPINVINSVYGGGTCQ